MKMILALTAIIATLATKLTSKPTPKLKIQVPKLTTKVKNHTQTTSAASTSLTNSSRNYTSTTRRIMNISGQKAEKPHGKI